MKRVALLLVLCAAATACGKAQAKTPGPAPALAVPEPPTRVVFPVTVDAPPTPPAADKPAGSTTTRPATNKPAPTPTPSPTPVPTTEPPPVLQTSASLQELETKAVEKLAQATKDLGRVKRDALPKNAQDQFDSAERYISMARDAMKLKNFVYATFCAEKASTLAGLLIK